MFIDKFILGIFAGIIITIIASMIIYKAMNK